MNSWSSVSLMITMTVLISSATKVRSDATTSSSIENTCKQTPNYSLCVSLLKSDTRSSTADTAGLALVLVDKIKAKATETLDEIKSLETTRPELKQPLMSCRRNYNAILEADVPQAVEALSKGVPKFGEDGVADAAVEASLCEAEFKGKSPLTNLTKSMQDIADVARAVVRMLL